MAPKYDRDIEIQSQKSLFLFLSFSSFLTLLSLSFETYRGGEEKLKGNLEMTVKMLITSKNLLKIRSIFNEDCFYKCLSVNKE